MYPVLFRIGSFEVSSFGVLVALGVVLGMAVLKREMKSRALDTARGEGVAVIAVLGGLAGAKLLYVLEHTEEPLLDNLLARGGLSWFGGLAGGIAAGLAALVRARLPLVPTLAAAAPALALGQAVGRVGCFLVGDDYGRPTSLPWGVAFPRGLPPTSVPVHPTQLYETVGLALVGWLLLRWRRRGLPDHAVVGRYFVLAGALRFAIEFIRVNERVVSWLTVAHISSAAAILLGLTLAVIGRRSRASSAAAMPGA